MRKSFFKATLLNYGAKRFSDFRDEVVGEEFVEGTFRIVSRLGEACGEGFPVLEGHTEL